MSDQNAALPAEEEIEIQIVDEIAQPDDELDRHTKNVSRRVNKLNQKARESEARAQQMEHALLVKEQELQQYRGIFVQQHHQTLAAEEQKIKAQEAQVDDIYKKAVESSDADLMSKATTLKNDIAIKKEKLNVAKAQAQPMQQASPDQSQYQAYQQPQQPQQPVEQPVPEPTAEAKNWHERNSWYGDGENEENLQATQFAYFTHYNLVNEGFEPDSDEYYDALDSRVGKVYPDLIGRSGNASTETVQQESRPTVQRVASASPAGRSQTRGEKSGVRFSSSELATLKSLKPHSMSEQDWLKSVAKEKVKIQNRGAR